jgi:DNA modification methylase
LDSCNADDIEKLMNGQKAEISFTSPPYNAGTTPTEVKMNKKSKYINDSDDKNETEYLQFLIDFTNNSLLFSEYSFVNIQSLSGNKTALIDYLYKLKSLYADTIIWNKQNSQPAMAENVLNSQFEYIHIFSYKANRSIGTKKFRGTLKNIIDIPRQNNNEIKEHNATFSVDFALYFVENFCEKSVLDLFCGSGTTAVASLKTKRNCFTNDISENYVQVAVKRIIDFCKRNEYEFEITLNGEKFDVEKLN